MTLLSPNISTVFCNNLLILFWNYSNKWWSTYFVISKLASDKLKKRDWPPTVLFLTGTIFIQSCIQLDHLLENRFFDKVTVPVAQWHSGKSIWNILFHYFKLEWEKIIKPLIICSNTLYSWLSRRLWKAYCPWLINAGPTKVCLPKLIMQKHVIAFLQLGANKVISLWLLEFWGMLRRPCKKVPNTKL